MKKIVILIFTILLFITIFPINTRAVAGRHGGGHSSHISSGHSSIGGHSGFSNHGISTYGGYSSVHSTRSPFRSLLFDLLFLGLAGRFILKKKIDSRQMKTAAKNDFLASIPGNGRKKRFLIKDIESIFLTIQDAWNQKSLEDAHYCYTSRLFQNHQTTLQEQLLKGINNRTEKVAIKELSNYRLINPNSFSVQIFFTCLDYEEELTTGRILSGSKKRKQAFLQTWYFDYDESDQRWKADFIQPISLN